MSFQAHSKGKARVDDSQRVVPDREDLRGVDFSGRRLVQFSAAGSRLEACRFDKAKIEDASFGSGRDTSEYVECRFDGARIRFGSSGFARFVRCSFRDVDLRDWFCFAVELIDCTFSGRLHKAFFNGTVPRISERALAATATSSAGTTFRR